jgi:DNA-binding MarR family transcriptional regulator
VDSLVRAGLVERTQDPDNRRRLALRLTERGRDELANQPRAGSGLTLRLERLAQSELRAIERAIEILERAS